MDSTKSIVETTFTVQVLRCGCGKPETHTGKPCPQPKPEPAIESVIKPKET